MHNFIAYFWKGGDFLKSYWGKWPRKQVVFCHGWTVIGAESNIFTCKLRSIFKSLRLITLSHIPSYTSHKAANSKVFTCQLRDSTNHSKGLITSRKAMHMNSVLPAVMFLAWFIRWAAPQAWLPGKFPLGILASQYRGSWRGVPNPSSQPKFGPNPSSQANFCQNLSYQFTV